MGIHTKMDGCVLKQTSCSGIFQERWRFPTTLITIIQKSLTEGKLPTFFSWQSSTMPPQQRQRAKSDRDIFFFQHKTLSPTRHCQCLPQLNLHLKLDQTNYKQYLHRTVPKVAKKGQMNTTVHKLLNSLQFLPVFCTVQNKISLFNFVSVSTYEFKNFSLGFKPLNFDILLL